MKKIFLILLVFLNTYNIYGQCCVGNKLDISTGYDPKTDKRAITQDPKWIVISANAAAIASSKNLTINQGGYIGNSGWSVPGIKHNYISFSNNLNTNDNLATGDPSATFKRTFNMCNNDDVTFNLNLSRDNYMSDFFIDGIRVLPNDIPSTLVSNYNSFQNINTTLKLQSGSHSITITIHNRNVGSIANPVGFCIEGLLTSKSNSIVQESEQCIEYTCNKSNVMIGFDESERIKEKEICIPATTEVSLFSSLSGNNLTSKWQVSSDGGITWSDLPAGNGNTCILTGDQLASGNYLLRMVYSTTGNIDTDPCPSYSNIITLNSINCCEDPCSWSKTGNDNITSANFLGTRNDADLNFKTNNEVRFKISNSNRHSFDATQKGNISSGVVGSLTTQGSGLQLGPKLGFHKAWGAVWAVGVGDNTDQSFNIFEDSWNNDYFSNGISRIQIRKGNVQPKVVIPEAKGNFHTDFPSGWGGGIATWDIACASIRYTNLSSRSDLRLKENIELFNKNGLKTIEALSPVTYIWKDKKMPQRKVYGFIAQEIQKILPEIVESSNDEQKTLSMSYIDIIPITVQAIKELNAKVEKQNNAAIENEELKAKIKIMDEKFALLEKSIAALCENGCGGLKEIGAKTTSDVDALFQSIPNPTDDVALINYYLTKEYNDATISISTTEGKTIQTINLESKVGNGSVKISLGSLAQGTYLYTLVAGKRVVDAKKLQIMK